MQAARAQAIKSGPRRLGARNRIPIVKVRRALTVLPLAVALLCGCGDRIAKLGAILATSPESVARRKAAKRLHAGRSPDAAPYLFSALEDSDDEVRAAVAEALGSIASPGSPEVQALARALSDPADIVKIAAAKGLGAVCDRSVAGRLAQIIADDNPEVRTAVADSLGKIGANSPDAVYAEQSAIRTNASEHRQSEPWRRPKAWPRPTSCNGP